MQVLSVGEVLWDVFPEKELLGGAPLNFAVNTVRLGHGAAVIASVGDDERGRRALEAMTARGVDTQFVQRLEGRETGVAVVSTSAEGEPVFRIPRPAAFDFIEVSAEAMTRARELNPNWLYFGTLVQMEEHVEAVTQRLAQAFAGMRCFYDMNLRPGCWNLALVQRLSGMATVLKLNEFEAQTLGALTGMGAEVFSLEQFCGMWAAKYGIECICVTLGPAGCLIFERGAVHTVPGYPATVKDTVGAGDAFAAAFLHGFHKRWPTVKTARFANALGSIVAGREGATPEWTMEECLELAGMPLERVDAGHH